MGPVDEQGGVCLLPSHHLLGGFESVTPPTWSQLLPLEKGASSLPCSFHREGKEDKTQEITT